MMGISGAPILLDYYLPVAQALERFETETGRRPTLILANPAGLPEGLSDTATAVDGIPVEQSRAIHPGSLRLVIEPAGN